MRLAIRKYDNREVLMNDKFIKGEEFICKCCNSPVIPKCGEVNDWHFAHKSNLECAFSKKSQSANSMSAFHREFQDAFYQLGAELEKPFGSNIADVFYKGRVFEVQHSPINITTVKDRNRNYLKHTGNRVIWILDGTTQNIANYPMDGIKVRTDFDHSSIFFYINNLEYSRFCCTIEDAVSLIIDVDRIQSTLRNVQIKETLKRQQEIYDEITSKLQPKYGVKYGVQMDWVSPAKSFPRYMEALRKIDEVDNLKNRLVFFNILRQRLTEIEKYIYERFFADKDRECKKALKFMLEHDEEVEIFTFGVFEGKSAIAVYNEDRDYFSRYLYSQFRNPEKTHHHEARGIVKYLLKILEN
jgi:hypothetical protein